MTGFLRLSSRTYAHLLRVYPEDLRRDFGSEMVMVFSDDMAEAWHNQGTVGVLRVWLSALEEVVHIGLPRQAANPTIVVPALSFFVAAAMNGAQWMLALHRMAGGARAAVLIDALPGLVLWPSLVTGLISLVAVRISKSSSAISLQLAERRTS